MPRATLVVSVDEPGEVAAVEAWLARWSARLSHCSDNHGCGCCVDIWEVEGPAEALAEIPPACHSGGTWSHGG